MVIQGKEGVSKKNLIDLTFIFIFAILIVSMFNLVIADTTFSLNITNATYDYSNTTHSTFSSYLDNNSVVNVFIQEDIVYVYNFSFGHLSTRNLTGINITLPAGFIFTDGSNKTGNNSGVENGNSTSPFFNWTLSGTEYTLYWNNTNLTGVIIPNGTASGVHNNYTYISFNVTAPDPGRYNITVKYIYNNSRTVTAFNQTFIQVKVNDTTAPQSNSLNVSITDSRNEISNNTVGYYHKGNIVLNVSIIENGIANVYFNLTNSSGHANVTWFYKAINSSTSNDDFWNYTLNSALLPDGNYTLWVWVNDSNNNANRTARINFTIDNTAPTGTFTCSPVDSYTGTTLTCACTSSDVASGVSTTTYPASPSTSNAGVGLTQSCTVVDLAGNTGIIPSNAYTIWGSPSSSSSSSSTSTSTATIYTKTIAETSKDFSEVSTIRTSTFSGGGLAVKEKVTFKLGSEEHYVGVKSLTTSSAMIEIASTPTQVSLNIGQEVKKDLNSDGFYDVYIKLNAITSGKADLTINYLHEEIPAEVSASEPNETAEPTSNLPWTWIIVGVIVLLVLVGGGFALKKKKK